MTGCPCGTLPPPIPERSGGLSGVGTRHHCPLTSEKRHVQFAKPRSLVDTGRASDRSVKRSTGVRSRAGADVTIAQSRERFLASLVHGIVSYTFPKTEHIFLGQQVAETHKCNPDTLDIKRTTDTNVSDSILCNLPRYKTSYQQVLTLRKNKHYSPL